ncbi:MAG: hypothetical protein D6795_21380, partial [Deltaproteobacteria bacterium]
MQREVSVWRRVLQAGIVAVAFFYVGRTFYAGLGELERTRFAFHLPLLLLSMALLLVYLLCQGGIWALLLGRSLSGKHPFRFGEALRVFLISQLGKYIPGRVWVLAGRIYFGGRVGIPRRRIVAVSVLADLFSILAASAIALPLLLRRTELPQGAFWALLPFAGGGVLLGLFPERVKGIANRLLVWLKRPPLTIVLRRRDFLLVFAASLLSWGIFAFGYVLFAIAVVETAPEDFLWVSASHIVALVLGFLSLVTPGGIGVREGILTYLLGFCYPAPIAAMMAVLSRLWLTIGELLS